MRNIALLLNFIQKSQNRKIKHPELLPQSNAGFTLIELIVVVVMVGVLATIAAPSWLTFLNQRRVNTINGVVFQALQEAQSEAKRTKRSYSVSFSIPAGKLPEIAVHPEGVTLGSNSNYWKNLNQDLDIRPGQVLVGTNLINRNDMDSSVLYTTNERPNNPNQRITFDYQGNLADSATGLADTDLAIVVAMPKPNTTEPIASTKRCVIVTTLLGSLETRKGSGAANCP